MRWFQYLTPYGDIIVNLSKVFYFSVDGYENMLLCGCLGRLVMSALPQSFLEELDNGTFDKAAKKADQQRA